MIKPLYNDNKKRTLLSIKTEDGKQIFYGEVSIHQGAFVDTDNIKRIRFTENPVSLGYTCEIEV